MVPQGKNAAAALSKSCDAGAVFWRKAVTHIQREKPKLIKIRFIKRAQDGIDTISIRFAVAGCDVIDRPTIGVDQRAKMFCQLRKTSDMPVILGIGNRCLNEDVSLLAHYAFGS